MKKKRSHVVSSGDLRFLTVLQKRTQSEDDLGGRSETWADVENHWADIVPMSAVERSVAAQLRNEVSHVIEIRFTTEIKTGMRFKHYNELEDTTEYYSIEGFFDVNNRKRRLMVEADQRFDFDDEV